MSDLLMLGLGALSFAACAGYVAWCDRIIGPDPQTAETDDHSTEPQSASLPNHHPTSNPTSNPIMNAVTS